MYLSVTGNVSLQGAIRNSIMETTEKNVTYTDDKGNKVVGATVAHWQQFLSAPNILRIGLRRIINSETGYVKIQLYFSFT